MVGITGVKPSDPECLGERRRQSDVQMDQVKSSATEPSNVISSNATSREEHRPRSDIMANEMTHVKPSDVEFLEEVRVGENSAIFKVHVHGQLCAMKVFHGRAKLPGLKNSKRERDLWTRELTAYRLLKEKGLCARGVVPDFYGAVKQIQPADWPDALHRFCDDEEPANAILIEYIPNMQMISLDNFSEAHLSKLSEILEEIHALRILHSDVYPRNMMVAKGQQGQEDRVLWIDFDAAWTDPPDDDWSRELFEEERQMMQYFVKVLTEDYKDGTGKLNKAWKYYYTYG